MTTHMGTLGDTLDYLIGAPGCRKGTELLGAPGCREGTELLGAPGCREGTELLGAPGCREGTELLYMIPRQYKTTARQ